MKILTLSRFCCLIFLLILNATAIAGTPVSGQQVTDNQLKIVGISLENNGSHEILALVCVGERLLDGGERSCIQLQHVLFNSDRQIGTYLGPALDLLTRHEPYAAEMTRTIRDDNEKEKKFASLANSPSHRRLFTAGAALGSFAFALTASERADAVRNSHGQLAGLGVTAAAIAVYVAGVFAVHALMNNHVFPESGSTSVVEQSQNGWDWKSPRKRVSEKRFGEYVRYLSRN